MNGQYFNRMFLGLILIGLGIMFLLNQTGHFSWDLKYIFSTYWPVIIIYFCLKGLLESRRDDWSGGSMIWNLFGLLIGVFFLGQNLGFINWTFRELFTYIIPIGLIVFGITMIFKPRNQAKQQDHWEKWGTTNPPSLDADDEDYGFTTNKESTGSEKINKSTFMGDIYYGQQDWELRPMNLSLFIGDTVLDLTRAYIPYGETKITISSFIGDVKIFVPNDIELEVSVVTNSFIGDTIIFDRKKGGMMSSVNYEEPGFQIADKRVRIIVSTFIGDTNVQRIG